MKSFLLFLALTSLSAHAGWSDKARSFLPAKVQLIVSGKTDREAARKILGKPALARADKEYWIIDDFKYALELTYKNNKVAGLHYNFPKTKFSLEDLKKDIDPNRLKSSPTSPHTSLIYEDKEGKMEVDLTSGQVESVRLP